MAGLYLYDGLFYGLLAHTLATIDAPPTKQPLSRATLQKGCNRWGFFGTSCLRITSTPKTTKNPINLFLFYSNHNRMRHLAVEAIIVIRELRDALEDCLKNGKCNNPNKETVLPCRCNYCSGQRALASAEKFVTKYL